MVVTNNSTFYDIAIVICANFGKIDHLMKWDRNKLSNKSDYKLKTGNKLSIKSDYNVKIGKKLCIKSDYNVKTANEIGPYVVSIYTIL